MLLAVAIGLVAATLAVAAGDSAVSADIATQVVFGSASLDGIACPTASNCEAVGGDSVVSFGSGVVVPIVNGTAGSAVQVSGTTWLDNIACPTANTCEAVGDDLVTQSGGDSTDEGVVVSITDGVPDAALPVSGSGPLVGISCPTADNCEAWGEQPAGMGGADQQLLVPIIDGTPGDPVAAADIASLVCADASTCEAVGENASAQGVVTPIANGVPGAGEVVPATSGFAAIACSDASTCEAVGENASAQGVIVPITDGAPGGAQMVPDTTGFDAIACPDTGTCEALAVDSSDQGVVVPFISGVPGSAEEIPSNDTLDQVGCESVTTCIAVGEDHLPGSPENIDGAVVALTLVAPPPAGTTGGSTPTTVATAPPSSSTTSLAPISTTTTPSPETAAEAEFPARIAIGPNAAIATRSTVSIKLSCQTKACIGTVKITESVKVKHQQGKKTVTRIESIVLGAASYRIAPRRSEYVKVGLNATGRKVLLHVAKTPLSERAVVTVDDGPSATKSLLIS